MGVYSDFELKIIALAKKDVEESPNYRVLADLESFILKQLAFKKFSDYKFRNWNKHHGEEFLQKFRDWEQEIMAERDNLSQAEFEQRSPVISENDIIDIGALSDKDKVIFYKAKADLLVHEFSESNIFFLEIFLLLIEQMLKMNKRPTGARMLEKHTRFPIPPASVEYLAKHRLACDHEAAFLSEAVVAAPEGISSKHLLYQQYRSWIESRGYKPVGSSRFNAAVKAAFPDVREERQRSPLID